MRLSRCLASPDGNSDSLRWQCFPSVLQASSHRSSRSHRLFFPQSVNFYHTTCRIPKDTSGRRSPNLVPSINLSRNSKQGIPSEDDGDTSPCLSSPIRHALRRIKRGSTTDRSGLLFVALRATLWDGHLISIRIANCGGSHPHTQLHPQRHTSD